MGNRRNDTLFNRKAFIRWAKNKEEQGYQIKLLIGGYFDMILDGKVEHCYFKVSNNLEAENILFELLHTDPLAFKPLTKEEISLYIFKFEHKSKIYRVNLDAVRAWLRKDSLFAELLDIKNAEIAKMHLRANVRNMRKVMEKSEGYIFLAGINQLKELGCIV